MIKKHVIKKQGCGFVEAVYQECMEMEFGLQDILFVPQPRLELELTNDNPFTTTWTRVTPEQVHVHVHSETKDGAAACDWDFFPEVILQ